MLDNGDAGYPSARAGWSAVVIMFLLYNVSMVDRNLMSLLAEPIKDHFVLSDVQFGLLYGTAFGIFYMLGAIPFGWAVDRFSRRNMIWAGVTIWSLGTVFCGLAKNLGGFFAGRSLIAAGEGVLVPASSSILPDMFPPAKLAFPISLYSLAAKTGIGMSLIVGAGLAALINPSQIYDLDPLGFYHGWQIMFMVAGLPGFLLALGIYLVPEPRRRGSSDKKVQGTFRDYYAFVRSNLRFILPHHGGMLAITMVTNGLVAWTPAFFMRAHDWDAQTTGLWLGISLAAGPMIGMPLHGWIVDRLFAAGRRDIHLRYAAFSILASLPVGIAAFLVPSPYAAAILNGAFFAIMCGYIPLPAAIMQIILPARLRGKSASILLALSALISMSIGPTLVGFLTQYVFEDEGKLGYSLSLNMLVGGTIAAGLFFLASRSAAALIAGLPREYPDAEHDEKAPRAKGNWLG